MKKDRCFFLHYYVNTNVSYSSTLCVGETFLVGHERLVCLSRSRGLMKPRVAGHEHLISALRHKGLMRDALAGHDGLSRQTGPLTHPRMFRLLSERCALRKLKSTSCAKSRTAAELCGPPSHPGTVNSLSKFCALASASVQVLREVTYCRRVLRPPFPPSNG